MHPSVYKRPLLWLVAALIVGLTFFYRPAPAKQDVSRFISSQEVTLIGQVVSFPVTKKDKQNGWINVLSVNGVPAGGRVYARIGNFTPQWKDTLQLTGRLQTPYSVHLPGNFDWSEYLARKQTFAEIKTTQAQRVKQAAWPWRVIRTVRQDILHTLTTSFPPEFAQIAGGVLLGERGDFPPDLYTAFQNSGAIHLLVASGGNVGFVTLITLAVGMLFGLRRRALLVFALGTAGAYTLIAGADAPLLRAYLMAVCACAGYFLGRNSGVFQGLLLSCLIILLITPSAVFDTGFQMSFLATLAIVICLNNYRVPGSWPKLARFFVPIFLATLASQLALLPVFTNVFYKVSLTGLLSNMLLVPGASFLMGLGFAYYVFSLLHIGIVLYYPYLWSLEIFELLVRFFASFQFSSLSATSWNVGSIVAYYVALFWVLQLPHKNFAKKLALPCLIIAVLFFGIGRLNQNRPKVYLLSEWNNRAAIVRINRKTALVFNDGLDKEKIEHALYALGFSQASLMLPLAGEVIFDTIWPGDKFSVPGGKVRATWELRRTQDGHVWEDTGYSGKQNSGLSYCVQAKKREICIGSHARFLVLPDGKTVSSELNNTVNTNW